MLFEPLGLDDTASYPHPPRSFALPEPQVKVWSKDTVLKPEGALTTQGPDGGIVSTLTDQVRFLQAVVNGEVFDDPDTWQRMQEAHRPDLLPHRVRARRDALRAGAVDVAGLPDPAGGRPHRVDRDVALPLRRARRGGRRRLRRRPATPPLPVRPPRPPSGPEAS
jgi:CubicO group peptidase (beta-lactamase class C family)